MLPSYLWYNGSIAVNKIFVAGFLQFFLGFSKVPVFLCHPVVLVGIYQYGTKTSFYDRLQNCEERI
jgi:hypothetical protein